MRIAFIKGHSRYGLLRCFSDAVIAALRGRGDDVVILDLMEFPLPDLGAHLKSAGTVDFVFSFNICSDYRDPSGKSIFEITGAPHVVHFVDHPLHHLERLKATPKETAVLFVDRHHPNAVDKLLGLERFAYCGFCAHGALGEAAAPSEDAEQFISRRPITALFAGTLYRPSKAQMDQLPDQVRGVFDYAIDMAMACDGIDAVMAIDETLRALGMDPDVAATDPELSEGISTIRNLSYLVDDYVRSHRRIQLFEALIDSGIPLTLAGQGYDDYASKPQIDYIGQIPTADIPALMQRARMVFSANANFGSGSHERPLTAMLAGAVAATDFSTFYDETFRNGREIALFRWTKFASDFSDLHKMSNDPEVLFAMGKAGQAAVAPAHRWLHRIDTYYAAAKAAKKTIKST